MIAGIIAMIIIHEGGHFVAAKAFGMKATHAFFGFGPTLWSVTRGETEYGVKVLPLGGFVRIIGMNPFEEIAEEDEHRTYRVAPFWKKAVVVLAGVFTHFVVAFFLLWFVGVMWGEVVIGADGRAEPSTTVAVVSAIVPGTDEPSPALVSGIEPADVIVAVDGDPITTWEEFSSFAAAHGDEDISLIVVREEELLGLSATLATVERPIIVDNEFVIGPDGEPVTEEIGFFGISPKAEREDVGPIAMIPRAGDQFVEVAGLSVYGMGQLVIGLPELVMSLFGGDDEIRDTVRPVSPIGLVQLAGPLESTLMLLALVNIFVGILNFVPFYPLDGGHFAVALYEKITGKVPNVQRLLPLAAALFILLISLGLMGVYLDITDPMQL